MSDANLSADKIRATPAEANGCLRMASAEYFDLLEKGLSSSPLHAKTMGESAMKAATGVFTPKS